MNPTLLSPASLAERWQMETAAINRMIVSKQLPSVIILGSARIPLESIEEIENAWKWADFPKFRDITYRNGGEMHGSELGEKYARAFASSFNR